LIVLTLSLVHFRSLEGTHNLDDGCFDNRFPPAAPADLELAEFWILAFEVTPYHVETTLLVQDDFR
jgi:hypothetical protein